MQSLKFLVGSLLLAALTHEFVFSSAAKLVKDGDIGTHSLTYLGTVDGKSFFAELYPLRTWVAAKQLCTDSQMQLASITSENQEKLLFDQNEKAPNYTGAFWTSGRDSQLSSNFLWETANSVVSNPGMNFSVIAGFQTCLAYVPVSNELRVYLCTATCGVLCEVQHSTPEI